MNGYNVEQKLVEENINTPSPSTNKSIPAGFTPKRSFVPKHFGTPLQAIKERENVEKEDKNTSVPFNPFDVKADALYFPACSPSVFATFSRNKTNNGAFRWSIEQLSFLYPADIDETSVPDGWMDPDQEVKAQKAIDAFFSQNSIVPSPWASSSSETEGKSQIKLRRTAHRTRYLSTVPSNDAETQTMLSIPPDVDLTAVLGNFFTFHEESNDSSSGSRESSFRDSDVMSVSSLRRKLFVADEDCSTPLRIERKDLNAAKQWSTPTKQMRSFHSSPASDLFSSSPITPPNCGDCCNVVSISSPAVSPIAVSSSRGRIHAQSFNERLDEDINSQTCDMISVYSVNTVPENSMSFGTESQDAVICPYGSERQDTGYITGSMCSSQNVTSEVTSGFHSKITPVAELMDECGISNSESCNMSSMKDCPQAVDEYTIKTESVSHNLNIWPWLMNDCSTPANPVDL